MFYLDGSAVRFFGDFVALSEPVAEVVDVCWRITKAVWRLVQYLAPKAFRLVVWFMIALMVVGVMLFRRGREFRQWCDRFIAESQSALGGETPSEDVQVMVEVVVACLPVWSGAKSFTFRAWQWVRDRGLEFYGRTKSAM